MIQLAKKIIEKIYIGKYYHVNLLKNIWNISDVTLNCFFSIFHHYTNPSFIRCIHGWVANFASHSPTYSLELLCSVQNEERLDPIPTLNSVGLLIIFRIMSWKMKINLPKCKDSGMVKIFRKRWGFHQLLYLQNKTKHKKSQCHIWPLRFTLFKSSSTEVLLNVCR